MIFHGFLRSERGVCSQCIVNVVYVHTRGCPRCVRVCAHTWVGHMCACVKCFVVFFSGYPGGTAEPALSECSIGLGTYDIESRKPNAVPWLGLCFEISPPQVGWPAALYRVVGGCGRLLRIYH